MKKNNIYNLTPKDEKIIHVFSDLGMPKNLAKTLLYISQVDECRSAEIERGTELRQPEVSVAMQQLQNRGWIEKRDLRKKGKGRPVHLYKLTTSIEDITKGFEDEKNKEIDSVKKDIKDLWNLIESR
ncbi:MAG: ArsR family transcriptional regulator [Thermoplasmatales archaeon]|nr:MAG: ArsR family transcriptional regulator [Thermoplasmatales archaeon]